MDRVRRKKGGWLKHVEGWTTPLPTCETGLIEVIYTMKAMSVAAQRRLRHSAERRGRIGSPHSIDVTLTTPQVGPFRDPEPDI